MKRARAACVDVCRILVVLFWGFLRFCRFCVLVISVFFVVSVCCVWLEADRDVENGAYDADVVR